VSDEGNVKLFQRLGASVAAAIIVALSIGGCAGGSSGGDSPPPHKTVPETARSSAPTSSSSGALTLSPLDAKYEHRYRPAFSIRYPSACGTPQDASQLGVVDINIVGCQPIRGLTTRQSYTFSFAILSFSAGLTDPCSALHMAFKAGNVTNVRYMPALNDGLWRTCVFTHSSDRGIAWTQLISNRIWLLFGKTANQTPTFNFLKPLFKAMRNSWHLQG
jgi:hypothetical protein